MLPLVKVTARLCHGSSIRLFFLDVDHPSIRSIPVPISRYKFHSADELDRKSHHRVCLSYRITDQEPTSAAVDLVLELVKILRDELGDPRLRPPSEHAFKTPVVDCRQNKETCMLLLLDECIVGLLRG